MNKTDKIPIVATPGSVKLVDVIGYVEVHDEKLSALLASGEYALVVDTFRIEKDEHKSITAFTINPHNRGVPLKDVSVSVARKVQIVVGDDRKAHLYSSEGVDLTEQLKITDIQVQLSATSAPVAYIQIVDPELDVLCDRKDVYTNVDAEGGN